MASDKDKLRQQQQTQQNEYNGYSGNFGDIAQWYAQHNPASAMFSPDWYYNAENQNQSGMQNASDQQQALGQQADKYDAMSDNYDSFAAGVGGQLAAGQQKQQQNADNQQNQADWLWQHPGYTDQEKQAMSTSAATPVAGSYTAAAGDLRNTAARTGNGAAYGAQAADLARKKAQDLSMVGLNTQGQFANQRIQGQQFAAGAQGSAGQAQGAANANAQGGANLQSNILNTGQNIRQGGANIRLGAAGSQLQRSATAQGAESTMQNAQSLSMAPAQLAAGMYGTIQNARNGVMGSQTTLASQPGFLKQLALAGVQGAAGIGAAAAGKPK